MKAIPLKILGFGKHHPPRAISAAEIDARAGLAPGWTLRHSGVHTRYFAENETASAMGAQAAARAIEDAGLSAGDMDCVVAASGTIQQPIPCNAALIQREFGDAMAGVAAFDVSATCLSFVTALDVLAPLVASGRYKKILVVSSDLASVGLDWSDPETCTILGDGAGAVVLAAPEPGESSRLLAARMETHSDGVLLTQVPGGGSALPGWRHDGTNTREYLFQMDGKAVFRFAAERMPEFTRHLLDAAQLQWQDIRLVIPHQASLSALRLIRKRLGLDENRFFVFGADGGNRIAATIPIGLAEAWQQGRVKRGDKVMLVGTSAGFSMGGVILEL